MTWSSTWMSSALPVSRIWRGKAMLAAEDNIKADLRREVPIRVRSGHRTQPAPLELRQMHCGPLTTPMHNAFSMYAVHDRDA